MSRPTYPNAPPAPTAINVKIEIRHWYSATRGYEMYRWYLYRSDRDRRVVWGHATTRHGCLAGALEFLCEHPDIELDRDHSEHEFPEP